tara:strand:- start:14224 stop:15459 length:1236 start_codon:yes stop_codon:yes gene_type:complete
MKIGGYKNNPDSSQTIDLTPEVKDTGDTAAEPKVEAPVAEPKVESQPEPTSQPEIQDTSKEIQVTGEFDKPKTTETAQKADEDKSSLNTKDEPTATVEVDEPKKEAPVEISDELHLKYLSEKLGREIKSLDDLTPAEATNPLDSDPYLKGLAEWRDKTGRPIEDWIKFQKDYTKVSDEQVAREFLQLQYPELTPEEINLEVNRKYLSSEDDFDDDRDIKNLELKKIASQGRKELQKLVSDLGNPTPANYTPEVQQDLDLAKQYKTLVKQNEDANKQYNQNIVSKASELKSIKLDLADGVSLDFKLPEGSDKNLVNHINNAPSWKTEDGNWNHEAIVRDTAIISNYENMLKLAYEQGKNSGADDVIREAKNTTLDSKSSSGSAIPNQNSGVQIEGLDNYLGKRGMSIIRGKR